MYEISSDVLKVQILDPEKDTGRFGTRYMTAGFIFQVYDNKGRALLSGPTYPESYNTFDGQGIPDCFNHAPIYTGEGSLFVVPGIGVCDLKENRIVELSKWHVEKGESSIIFSTRYTVRQKDFYMIRKVSVVGAKISSHTLIDNVGEDIVSVSWYPHPFFPHVSAGPSLSLERGAILDYDTGYYFLENGNLHIRKKENGGWSSFQPIHLPGENNLYAVVHADSYDCVITNDFYAHTYPVWANVNTVSIEPYYENTVFSRRKLSWSMNYEFRLK